MAERVQTYKNHLRWLPAFHFFVLPVLLLNVLNEVRRAWRNPSEGALFIVVVAVALFTLAFLSRTQALTVQDRVIRLEMRQRLAALLPREQHAAIAALSPRQCVALRFAGDAELPELVAVVVKGNIQEGKAIKKLIKNWTPDHARI
jgi:hypothetical protein